MADSNAVESPLEAAAEGAGPQATEAFSVLGNETRLAILLALWEAYEPFAEDPTDYTKGNEVTFTELRERVGMRDPGQFHYHLEKLIGRFVRKIDDGYELHPAGNRIVRTVIGSAGFEKESFPTSEINLDCQYCDAPTAITYQNYRLYHVCTECEGRYDLEDKHPSGVINAWRSKQAILSHRAAETILLAGFTEVYLQYALQIGGICPWCSGRVDHSFHICDAHDAAGDSPCPACGRRYEVAVRLVCTVCKATNITQIEVVPYISRHPAVAEFYREHGVEHDYTRFDLEFLSLFKTYVREVETELLSTKPLQVQFTIPLENGEHQLLVDEELNITDVSGPN